MNVPDMQRRNAKKPERFGPGFSSFFQVLRAETLKR